MLSKLEQNLRFLGLSKDEANIYLALLQYGMQPVAGIARLTHLGRINCYHHLEKLRKSGFITESQTRKTKHYSAENPQIFINRAKESLNLASDLLPELQALTLSSPRQPKVQFFEGEAGIKNIFQAMLEARDQEIVSFSHLERLAQFSPNWLREHLSQRLEKNIKSRFIASRTHKTENFKTEFFPAEFNQRLLEIFLISPQEFQFESDIVIFPGSIAIMNLDEHHSIGALIQSDELYRTQKAIFDLAWLGATSFIT